MLDFMTQLTNLKRPKLLVSAARLGQNDYRRKAHLKRILGGAIPTKASAIFDPALRSRKPSKYTT